MPELDLPVLTIAELNRAYEDLTFRLADYSGVYGDALHNRLQAVMDELHARAITCFNEENDLYGTVGGVPGVQYGTRRRRLRLPS